MVDFAPPKQRKRPSTAGSTGTRDSRLSWGSSLLQKSTNSLSSMASSSLNALRRTRSRNDPPPSSFASNSADKPNPPLASPSRSNSWTSSLGRRSSTKSSSVTTAQANPTDSPTSITSGSASSPLAGIDRDPPTPPSESSSSRSSTSSHDTFTPPASAQQQQQQSQQSQPSQHHTSPLDTRNSCISIDILQAGSPPVPTLIRA